MKVKMVSDFLLGIDIGGTNTDGVLVGSDGALVASFKGATTPDLVTGFKVVLEGLLRCSQIDRTQIKALFISSTHATNALLEARNLNRVGVIRIAQNNPQDIPPCSGWPDGLRNALELKVATVSGGYELDGSPLALFDEPLFLQAVHRLQDEGVESLALVGVFSPLYADQEREGAALVKRFFPALSCTCSCDVGTVGFLDRENAAILNAALKKVLVQGFADLEQSCAELLPEARLFAVQNNGSTITMEVARAFPLLMLATGPTNSFMGAAALSRLSDCIVVDVGGTSTDIGLVRRGVARRSLGTSYVAGVPLNFSMPDVVALACGGGSLLSLRNGLLIREKESVGAELFNRAVSFGGDLCTLTDAALKSGLVDGSIFPARVQDAKCFSQSQAVRLMEAAAQEMAHVVERFALREKAMPVVMVGGGARLFPRAFLQDFFPQREVICPQNGAVANAYGAACALVSGVVDEMVSLECREKVLGEALCRAEQRAIEQGADPRTLRVVEKLIMPCTYVSRPMARTRIVVAGSYCW